MLLTVLVACADAAPSADSRRFVDVEWDTAFVVGGDVQDSVLLIPRLLTAGDGQIYVYDYGDSRLKAFGHSGELLWMTGRSGGGPEEFGNPLDIEVGPDGLVWVVDGGNGRLVRVSPDGSFHISVPLRGLLIRDIIPLRGQVLGTPIGSREKVWVMFNDSAREIRSGPPPLEPLRNAHPSTLQTIAALGSDGSTWAAVYPFGNILLVYRGEELLCTGSLIEGAAMSPAAPESLPQSLISAIAVLHTDSSVLVLARGASDAELRMLDEYGLPECNYRRTLRLPNRMLTAAKLGDSFIFTFETPAPALIGLRPERP